MSKYIETAEMSTVEIAVTRNTVVFPVISAAVEFIDPLSIAACERAFRSGGKVFFVAQKNITGEDVKPADLYTVGTIVKIKQIVKGKDKRARIIAEGVARAAVISYDFSETKRSAAALIKNIRTEEGTDVREAALIRTVKRRFEEFARHIPQMPNDLLHAAMTIEDPGLLADFIASSTFLNNDDKQTVLEEFDPIKRLELLGVLLESEKQLLELEHKIQMRVRERIDTSQKEYYLREQLKVIQEELGMDGEDEEQGYLRRIESAKMPEECREHLRKEVWRLSRMSASSVESAAIRNYLDICMEIPFGKFSHERHSLNYAEKVLERDHEGMKEVKERILEYLAVKQISKEQGSQVICLVGPPGVGKTSIAASIAQALNLNFVRVSLGGVRDEADIRGHRKTYVGAVPGRIADAVIRSKTMNPFILLDEIDKMAHDMRGDPVSAMLEVLDPTQNDKFRDHFLEIPLDLRSCVFLATANNLDGVPRALIDRMEIIELKSYTFSEKMQIAKKHLLPKAKKRHGLKSSLLQLKDNAIEEIINGYTREAGVRELERQISAVCRKVAKKIVSGEIKKAVVTASDIEALLGARRIPAEDELQKEAIGVVNGLAYTEAGGDVLQIEVVSVPGNGKIQITGSLGDVMKESVEAAYTYIRSIASELQIPQDFYKTKDLHIHVPEGAVPKDGPSAGITIAVSIASELCKIPARGDIAMTGEITLHGKVLPIGGLREKTMAAYRRGIRKVIIPKSNVCDLKDVDPQIAAEMQFYPCQDAKEVLRLSGVLKDFADHETKSGNETQRASQIFNIPAVVGNEVRGGVSCGH